MRLTLRTNLAARVLMFCGVNSDTTVRSAQIAEATNASGNHLSQVIHQLQQMGYVHTRRGRGGGLTLARDPKNICIGTMFRDFEADVPFAECFDQANNNCPLSVSCRLKTYIGSALDAFYAELDNVTLQDLLEDNCGLANLLSLHPGETVSNCNDTRNRAAG